MRAFILTTTLICSGSLAFACPTSADLTKGIKFAVNEVDTEVYRKTGPAMIEAIYTSEGGTVNRAMLAQGIYLVEGAELIDGRVDTTSISTYTFPAGATGLQIPVPGTSVTYQVRAAYPDDTVDERHVYVFGEAGYVNFGACEYEIIPVEIRYEPDTSDTVDLLYYMPALEFSYYAGFDSNDGSDRYYYTNIEAVE